MRGTCQRSLVSAAAQHTHTLYYYSGKKVSHSTLRCDTTLCTQTQTHSEMGRTDGFPPYAWPRRHAFAAADILRPKKLLGRAPVAFSLFGGLRVTFSWLFLRSSRRSSSSSSLTSDVNTATIYGCAVEVSPRSLSDRGPLGVFRQAYLRVTGLVSCHGVSLA